MIHSFYLLLFRCALNLFYVPSLIANPIVGGYPDVYHAFNHQVSIHSLEAETNTYQFICSGTIVSQRHILTAAHCFMTKLNGKITAVYPPENGGTKIIAGTNKINGPGIEREIKQVLIPHQFNMMGYNYAADIAVAVLESNLGVISNNPIMRILPMDGPFRNNHEDNKKAIFSGYGVHKLRTGHDGRLLPVGGFSPINLYVNFVILPQSECLRYDSIICAKSMDPVRIRAPCHGDSGAGLIFERHVIGVLSTAPQNCNTNEFYTDFTRISYFKDFVDRAMSARAHHHDMYVLEEGVRFMPTASSSGQHTEKNKKTGSGGYIKALNYMSEFRGIFGINIL